MTLWNNLQYSTYMTWINSYETKIIDDSLYAKILKISANFPKNMSKWSKFLELTEMNAEIGIKVLKQCLLALKFFLMILKI